jgi:hypothetical protein
MNKLLLTLIFLLTACSNTADGRPRREIKALKVRLLITDKVSTGYALDTYKEARVIIKKQMNVRLMVRELGFIEDPNWPESLQEFKDKKGWNYFKEKVGFRRGHITVIVTGHLDDNYFAGRANGVCKPLDGFIMIYAKDPGDITASRKTVLIYTHEFGHAGLGAGHNTLERADGSCWIMHENASFCLGGSPNPTYHTVSIRAKNRCLNTGRGK